MVAWSASGVSLGTIALIVVILCGIVWLARHG
jgi:hypothetical protein